MKETDRSQQPLPNSGKSPVAENALLTLKLVAIAALAFLLLLFLDAIRAH
jgi:hypothetical protein